MSKFLLNLHLQISKASVYSKIKIVIQKIIFPHFRPNRPSGQPAHPAFPPRRSPFFFFSTGHRPPPSPHWASASRSAQLALSARPTVRWWCPALLPPPSRENTSPHATFAPLHARLTGGLHLSSPSSGAARDPLRAVDSLSRHGCRALLRPPLFMADRYDSLISAIITITASNSSPPLLISAASRYQVHRFGAPPPAL
jgi:hypothetical protein